MFIGSKRLKTYKQDIESVPHPTMSELRMTFSSKLGTSIHYNFMTLTNETRKQRTRYFKLDKQSCFYRAYKGRKNTYFQNLEME